MNMPPRKAQVEVATGPETGEQSQETRSGRVRASHACDRCREWHAKCSGGKRCIKCVKDDAECRYSDRKRERDKKSVQQYSSLKDDKRELLAALTDLIEGPHFQSNQHPELLGLIRKMSSETRPESSRSSTGSQSQGTTEDRPRDDSARSQETDRSQSRMNGVTPTHGEAFIASDIGSPDRQRELSAIVNLDHGTGMAGYVGKMSGMSWLQRVHEYLIGVTPLTNPDVGFTYLDYHVIDVTSLTYFMDDEDLLKVDEDWVQANELPPWQMAIVLSEAYFHSLQGAFCFVDRHSFYPELSAAYQRATRGRNPSWDNRKYLALANMMWAVGAKWLELTRLDMRPAQHVGMSSVSEGHLTYYARARALGLDHRMQLDHPSLPSVQGMGILAFHMMANGSIQRAWNLAGQAIRHATALGLHLRITNETVGNTELRNRARVWYSLSRLEVLLSEITGRPKCLHGPDATVSRTSSALADDTHRPPPKMNYPVPGVDTREIWRAFLGENQDIAKTFSGVVTPWQRFGPVAHSTAEPQFSAALDLSAISDKIGSELYLSPVDLTWADVQGTVRKLERELTNWEADLSPDLKLSNTSMANIDPRSNLELELYHCSIKMILYRPFLCEILIDEESQGSIAFNRLCAQKCVYAAIQAVNMMPDHAAIENSLQVLPWWGLLHYVCQAGAILLLELCLNVLHMRTETGNVMMAMRKVLQYLWVLSPVSKSAHKAWTMFRLLVEKVTQRYQFDMLTDVPQSAQKPYSWTEEDDELLRQCLSKMMQ